MGRMLRSGESIAGCKLLFCSFAGQMLINVIGLHHSSGQDKVSTTRSLWKFTGRWWYVSRHYFFRNTADTLLQSESAPTTSKSKAKPKRKTEDDPSKPKKKPRPSDSQKEVKVEGSSGEQP